MDLWTQRYGIQWAPVVSFYEHRYSILRSFEAGGLLRGFQSDEDSVAARLGDPGHTVTFGPTHLNASLLRPGADEDRIFDAARRIVDELRPVRMARATGGFQWLAPVDLDYDEARRSATRSLFGQNDPDKVLAGTTLVDYALLIDGTHPNGTYQIEIGVVKAEEVPDRFARTAGRMGGPDMGISPSLWPLDSLPEVAYFGDLRWRANKSPATSSDAVVEGWTATRTLATAVASGLFKHLGAD